MSAQSFRIETVRTWRVLRSNGTSIHTTTTCGRSTRCKSITAGAKLSSGPEQNGGDAGTEGGRTEGGERGGAEGGEEGAGGRGEQVGGRGTEGGRGPSTK